MSGVTIAIQHSVLVKERSENQRLAENLDQYGRDISTLKLTKKQIEAELEKKNQTLMEADSILKRRNRRINELEELVKTRIVIRDTDTVYVPLIPDQVPIKTQSPGPVLHKVNFEHSKSCITIAGYIISTDPAPNLAVTKREADVKVYDIRIRRRWFQFWRPREERFVETNCGEVEIETIIRRSD